MSSIKQRFSNVRVPRLVSRVILLATVGAGLTACVVHEPNYRAHRSYGSHVTVVEKQPRAVYRNRSVRPRAVPRARPAVAPRPRPKARRVAPRRNPQARRAVAPRRAPKTRRAVAPRRNPHVKPAARPVRVNRPAAQTQRSRTRDSNRSRARR